MRYAIYTIDCVCGANEEDQVRMAERYSRKCRLRMAKQIRKRRARVRTLVGVVALAAIMAGVFRAAAALMSGV